MFRFILLMSCLCMPLLAQSAEMKNADRMGRVLARKGLMAKVLGSFLTYEAQFDLGTSSVVITDVIKGIFNNCKTDILKEWPEYGMVLAKASMSRQDLMANLKKSLQVKLSGDALQKALAQLEKAFPLEEYSQLEYGIGVRGENAAKTFLKKRRENQLEGAKELLAFFKGPTVQASSRLENFVLTQDSLIANLASSIAGIDYQEAEPDLAHPESCAITATMTREAYIASLLLSLERSKNQTPLSTEEIAKLNSILPASHSVVIGGDDTGIDFE